MMSFRIWLEGNRPEIVPQYGAFANDAAKYIKPGTKIYRGLRIAKEARKKTIRQILIDSSSWKKNKNQSDPWTLDFPVSERFTKGAAITPDGISLGLDNTVHIIVEAELDGPRRDVIDWIYWGKTISGQGVSKGTGVKSYWQPQYQGRIGTEDTGIENEVPILHSAYPSLKLTGVYIQTDGKWIKRIEPNVLG